MNSRELIAGSRGRAWRMYADVRRRLNRDGSADPALSVFGRPDRRDLEEWNRKLAESHLAYRARFGLAATSAAVICVSRRPHMLAEIIDNVTRQQGVDIEFVLVTNDAGYEPMQVRAALASVPRAKSILSDPESTLGECLNSALDSTDERFVAKFDDDDWYGPHFLADSLRAHGYAGAAAVGKHTYYVEVNTAHDRYLRFPGHEFSYSGTLAGGTLVLDRARTGKLGFADLSLGEDRRFIADCHRRGLSTFAADRFGYVQRRTGDNTWDVGDDAFLLGSTCADPARIEHRVET